MTRTAFLAGAVGVLLLASEAIGQQTWIVDAANGPGTNFTDLPPAVSSALVLPGDTLLIRNGTYTAPVIRKGLTLIPEQWGHAVAFVGTLTIQGLTAAERCVMKRVSTGGFDNHMLCQDNEGAIHFEQVSTGGLNDNLLTIIRCKQVTMTGCGGSALVVDQSTVTLNDSSVFFAPPGPKPWAMSVINSKVILADSVIAGSPGQVDPFNCVVTQQPGAAVQMQNSDLLIAGPSGRIVGASVGTVFCGLLAEAPAAFGSGTITYDPAGLGIRGPVQGNIQVTQRSVPAQSARVDWPGGILALRVWGTANAPAAMLFSMPLLGAPSFACPTFCTGPHGWPGLWIDASAYFVAGIGITGSNKSFSLQIPIPGAFPILPLAFQSVVLNQSGNIDLSTVAVAILGPQGTAQ